MVNKYKEIDEQDARQFHHGDGEEGIFARECFMAGKLHERKECDLVLQLCAANNKAGVEHSERSYYKILELENEVCKLSEENEHLLSIIKQAMTDLKSIGDTIHAKR